MQRIDLCASQSEMLTYSEETLLIFFLRQGKFAVTGGPQVGRKETFCLTIFRIRVPSLFKAFQVPPSQILFGTTN